MVLRSKMKGGGRGHEQSGVGALQVFRIAKALGALSLVELDVL